MTAALIALLMPIAFATDEAVYRMAGKEYAFQRTANGDLISKECKDCMASKLKPKYARVKITGGMNPGAVLCKKALKSEVVIGVDKEGNQQSFCLFKDKSMVSTGSLIRRLNTEQ